MKRLLLAFALHASLVLVPTVAFSYSYLYTCGPSWTNLPVDYWINSAGSGDVPFGTLEGVIEDSFAEWGDPCCSNFAANYRGTTSRTAINNQGSVVLSWVESSWDPQWGSVNQTIGITFTSVFNNCTIAEAPILFNGIGFRFTTSGGGGTDLQSIATHEIGHLLGLSHSNVQAATMYFQYQGGTGARQLHNDDENGVCSLYTRSCSCTSNSQCDPGDECIAQQCQPAPCQNDNDCDAGLSCDAGSGACIIPPCATTSDCGPGLICEAGVCVSECPVCQTGCTTAEDCGTSGNPQCWEFNDGSSLCVVFCNGANSECPGDAVCLAATNGQQDFWACGAPGGGNEVCPANYVCKETDLNDECTNDGDCAGALVCRNSVNGNRCVEGDPCANVTCDPGFTCVGGACMGEEPANNNTTGNNTPGNNGTTGNNNTPNNSTGNNGNPNNTSGPDEPFIVIYADEEPLETGCCAVTSPRKPPVAMLALLIGIFLLRRRR